jgi:hypothetical protein
LSRRLADSTDAVAGLSRLDAEKHLNIQWVGEEG